MFIGIQEDEENPWFNLMFHGSFLGELWAWSKVKVKDIELILPFIPFVYNAHNLHKDAHRCVQP